MPALYKQASLQPAPGAIAPSANAATGLVRAGTKLVAQYGYLYDGLIAGMEGPVDPMPDDISGIWTPDPRTVVFRLTHPAGDFLHRLALPATAPVPEEVASCFPRAGDYGRYVISSGPYILEGADNVDGSACRRLQPMQGFDPTRRLMLVRNPEYDPGTDDPALREALPPTIEIRIDTNSDEIARDVASGALDAAVAPWISRYPAALITPPTDTRESGRRARPCVLPAVLATLTVVLLSAEPPSAE